MANARPTTWNTVNASIRRPPTPMDKLGSIPSVAFDPELMRVSHVAVYGSSLEAGGRYLTVEQATQKRLIEVFRYGNQTCVLIKSHSVQVVLVPSTGLMKIAAK